MSTKTVFIIFGALVGIITVPLIVVYFAFNEILGRYTGLVENTIVGLISSFVIAVTVDYNLRMRQEKESARVARIGLTQVSQCINRMLTMFGNMVKASSNGFLPTTIEELFGKDSLQLMSLHLDLNKKSPDDTNSWKVYLSNESKEIIRGLTSSQERYQSFFQADALVAIGTIQNSALLNIFTSLSSFVRIDAELGVKRPVLNMNMENYELLMQEILRSVKAIEKEAIKLNTDVKPRFSNNITRDDVLPKIGSSRYDGTPGPQISFGSELPKLKK